MSDNVEHPSHYNAGSVETIDGIRAALGDAFLDYCRGNVLKYVWRCRHKGKLAEDLRKAARYLEWAIAEAESEKPREPQELAIPDGWRELEPGELPRAEDMVEHGSSWVLRGGDSAMECEWHEVRMIRKIEPSNPNEPEQLAIPDGWRWLNAGEVIRKGDTDKSMKPVTNWWIGEICRHSHDLLRRNKFEVGEMVVDCRIGWNLRVQLVDKEYPIVFVEGVTNGIEVDHLAPYIEAAQ